MTADAIANVIADLRDGRVRYALSDVELNGVAYGSAEHGVSEHDYKLRADT
jgi:hypothetical protein